MNAHAPHSRIQVAVEDPGVFLLEAEALITAHAESAGRTFDEVCAEVNFSAFGSLVAQGMLVVLGARKEEELVGYAVVVLSTDLFSPRIVATLMVLFVLPRNPGVALRLARRALHEARELGCGAFWVSQTRDGRDSWRMDTVAAVLGRGQQRITGINWEIPMGRRA